MRRVLLAGALLALSSATAHADDSKTAPDATDTLSAPETTSGSTITTLSPDEPTDDTLDAASEAGVKLEDLLAAANSTGLKPRQYLISVGELMPPKPARPTLTGRLACIAQLESHNDPGATNPRSKAAGLFQFLWSTWLGTPQGKAGMSPYDPWAAFEAAKWMISQGRIGEWRVVQLRLC